METKKHHRRVSSYWIQPLPPITDYLNIRQRKGITDREIRINALESCTRYQLPNYVFFKDNEVCTTKYNVATFIPKNLWEQLHRLANIYFVFLLAIDFVPIFAAFDAKLASIPIIFVFTLTALKDGYEDLRRRRLDKQVNNSVCRVWDKCAGRFRKLQWRHVIVGDVVHISNDETFPADILLLRSSSDDGNVFVETSNLDGENNLKHKFVPQLLEHYCGEDEAFSASLLHVRVSCSTPTKDLNEIRGSVMFENLSEPFNVNNVLLRGCRLKNTTFVEGVVIYAGHDTKVMLNNGRAPYKRSTAEQQTNYYVLGCAVLLIALIAITTICRVMWTSNYPDQYPFALQTEPDWFSTIGNSLLIYQIMIPLALYITVELIKLGQVYTMQNDLGMYSAEKDEAFVARSTSIAEELGQITHLLSDKTGTLTQNKMILRYCATKGTMRAAEISQPFKRPPDADFHSLLLNIILCNSVFVQFTKRQDNIETLTIEAGVALPGDFFYDLSPVGRAESLCAETPISDESFADSLHFEGESPDEVALVKGARLFGYHLMGRSNSTVSYIGPDGAQHSLHILCILPFDPVRKRMTVVIESPDDEDKVIVYTKGADSAMLGEEASLIRRGPRRSTRSAPSVEEEKDRETTRERKAQKEKEDRLIERVEAFAKQGLRTLVMGHFEMDRTKFEEWLDTYRMVEMTRGDEEGDRLMVESANELERHTKAIGVTAVEDKLQEGVDAAISALRKASIQVWILTGDKKETAEGVATACSLFEGIPEDMTVDDFNSNRSYAGKDVVVSGEMIAELCVPESPALQLLDGSTSVLCYRLTPSQKGDIVKAVRARGGRVAAIGDGANDVPMIQAANVGIGISGSEGMQASMAADFVLSQFSFVSRLILLHGHWNYYRLAKMMLYFMYKNVQNVLINFFMQTGNGWSEGFVMNQLYSMLYPVIFTSLQPYLYGVREQDLPQETIMRRPSLYKYARDGQLYNYKWFVVNILDAIWQAAACYYCVALSIDDSSTLYGSFGFLLATSMFFTNCAHLLIETRCFNISVVAVHILCLFLHFGYFMAYDGILASPGLNGDDDMMVAEQECQTIRFWAVCLLASTVAVLPRFLATTFLFTLNSVRKLEKKMARRLSRAKQVEMRL